MYPLKDVLHFLSIHTPSAGSRASPAPGCAVDPPRQSAHSLLSDDDDADHSLCNQQGQSQYEEDEEEPGQCSPSLESEPDIVFVHPGAGARPEHAPPTSSTSRNRSRSRSAASGPPPVPNPELDSTSSSPSAKEIARLRVELKQARDKHYAIQGALREAQTQVRTKDILLEQLRERSRRLESDANEARRTAEERRQELRSMEHFLTKSDRWAGSDLVQAVKDINSEILQFAAAASEGFPAPAAPRKPSPAKSGSGSSAPSSGTATPVSSPSRRKALERVAARFGSKMRQCLEQRDHAQDPTILQYALQACVCQCIAHAVSSFCFGSTGKLESHLSKIYQHMHSSEPQPTSSRWRALTHAHIRALSPNLDNIAVTEVTDTALRGVANVLSAGGFGEVEALLTRASTRHRAQLRRIAELANRLAFVLREGTMSTDFQPLFVESVREFSPLTMENVYEGYGPSKGRVLCTTEVGLQCLTNKGKDGKDFSPQTIERRVVLKPRVVLESIVQVLDR
ncbi:hypothetical protein M0805_008165 [Coniferiporia weirii]|nr:hypothetical protein M0805_008165 [Coniferiporia weirii]